MNMYIFVIIIKKNISHYLLCASGILLIISCWSLGIFLKEHFLSYHRSKSWSSYFPVFVWPLTLLFVFHPLLIHLGMLLIHSCFCTGWAALRRFADNVFGLHITSWTPHGLFTCLEHKAFMKRSEQSTYWRKTITVPLLLPFPCSSASSSLGPLCQAPHQLLH